MPAPSRRVEAARQVARSVGRARSEVIGALQETEDAGLTRQLLEARKSLDAAQRRAQAVLRDLDLRDAPQSGLEL